MAGVPLAGDDIDPVVVPLVEFPPPTIEMPMLGPMEDDDGDIGVRVDEDTPPPFPDPPLPIPFDDGIPFPPPPPEEEYKSEGPVLRQKDARHEISLHFGLKMCMNFKTVEDFVISPIQSLKPCNSRSKESMRQNGNGCFRPFNYY
jgi:hypothetical protein